MWQHFMNANHNTYTILYSRCYNLKFKSKYSKCFMFLLQTFNTTLVYGSTLYAALQVKIF